MPQQRRHGVLQWLSLEGGNRDLFCTLSALVRTQHKARADTPARSQTPLPPARSLHLPPPADHHQRSPAAPAAAMPPKRRASLGAAAAAAAGGDGSNEGPAYRHCFLQAVMARQYLRESEAKQLYRQITGAASGERAGQTLPAHCRAPRRRPPPLRLRLSARPHHSRPPCTHPHLAQQTRATCTLWRRSTRPWHLRSLSCAASSTWCGRWGCEEGP